MSWRTRMRTLELTPLNYQSVRDLKMGHAEWAVCPMRTAFPNTARAGLTQQKTANVR